MARSSENRFGEALQLARAHLRHGAPYISTTLYGLVPYTCEGLGTLGVSDRLVLVIDPVWFVKMPIEQQASCLLHEISHVVRGQHRLAAMPDPDLANIAFDLPINYDLRAGGWTLPFGNYPETFGLPVGLTGEQYYELLDKQRTTNKKLQETLANKKRVVGQGRCGGCAGNPIDRAIEQQLNQQVGQTAKTVTDIRRSAAHEIRSYQARGRGSIPATLTQDLLDDVPHVSIVRWKDKMSHLIRRTSGRVTAGRSDYSYRRIARRSYVLGTIKPGMISQLPTVGFVEDTSASMGQTQTIEARQQAVDVMLQMGLTRAWWISADAAVAAPPRQLTLRQIRELPVIGRGGTDFRPAIEIAKSLRPKPDILMYLTDGDGTAPDEPPIGIEVIWCVVRGHFNRAPAEWGQTVVIADEAA